MKAIAKQRIDQLLVDRGLAESRAKAQALILAGSVLINRQKAQKPGQLCAFDSTIDVTDRPPFVSRGGLKLEAALNHFHVDVNDRICIDVGSSTGGFTDCLLQHGAAKVYAIDAGTAQLDWKLRSDPRVVVREQTNARYLEPIDIGELCSIAVCDVSFISVTLILPVLPALLTTDAHLVVLVKPQFEVGRDEVGKGGIVRDPALHTAACLRVSTAARQLGWRTSLMDSPILGAEGNREFLLHAQR